MANDSGFIGKIVETSNCVILISGHQEPPPAAPLRAVETDTPAEEHLGIFESVGGLPNVAVRVVDVLHTLRSTDTPKPAQSDLFKVMLRDLVAEGHELVLLRDAIDWRRFEKVLENWYENPYWQYFCRASSSGTGHRPGDDEPVALVLLSACPCVRAALPPPCEKVARYARITGNAAAMLKSAADSMLDCGKTKIPHGFAHAYGVRGR